MKWHVYCQSIPCHFTCISVAFRFFSMICWCSNTWTFKERLARFPVKHAYFIYPGALGRNWKWSKSRKNASQSVHDDVMKWRHFLHYWPFVQRIHRSPVDSPHKGQWRKALIFSLIYASMNDWVNSHEAGDLRPHHAHYNVTVMYLDVFMLHEWS